MILSYPVAKGGFFFFSSTWYSTQFFLVTSSSVFQSRGIEAHLLSGPRCCLHLWHAFRIGLCGLGLALPCVGEGALGLRRKPLQSNSYTTANLVPCVWSQSDKAPYHHSLQFKYHLVLPVFFILKSEMLTECMDYNDTIWIICVLIQGYLDQMVEELNIYLKKYLALWGGNPVMLKGESTSSGTFVLSCIFFHLMEACDITMLSFSLTVECPTCSLRTQLSCSSFLKPCVRQGNTWQVYVFCSDAHSEARRGETFFLSSSQEEPETRLAIQEALSMMVGAYSTLEGAQRTLMEALVASYLIKVGFNHVNSHGWQCLHFTFVRSKSKLLFVLTLDKEEEYLLLLGL